MLVYGAWLAELAAGRTGRGSTLWRVGCQSFRAFPAAPCTFHEGGTGAWVHVKVLKSLMFLLRFICRAWKPMVQSRDTRDALVDFFYKT